MHSPQAAGRTDYARRKRAPGGTFRAPGSGGLRRAMLLLLLSCSPALVTGCRLGWGGPVSDDVLNCRQLTQRGLSAMDRGDWALAETALGQAVQSCPVDSEARRHYAETLWRRGARQEALAQMQEAVRLAAEDPQLAVRLGEMLLAEERQEAALVCAQQALDIDPRLQRAWVLRAQAMQQAGRTRQALADYQRAIACDPGNREALLQMAELYRQLDQPQRALITLQALADTYSFGEEPPEVAFLTGLAYAALGRYEDAADCYARAAREQPTPDVLFQLADAHFRCGRPVLARQAAERALALAPEHEPSRQLLNALASAPLGRLQR